MPDIRARGSALAAPAALASQPRHCPEGHPEGRPDSCPEVV